MYILLFALSLFGIVLFCGSMRRHQRQFFGSPLTKSQNYLLRFAGYAVLAISAVVAVEGLGKAIGLTAFTGVLTVAILTCAFGVTLFTTYKDRR